MKISVLQENLSKAVNAASRATASRPQLPILSHVLLRAEKGRLLIVGTDLSTTIGLDVGGKVEKEGELTVPARDLTALVSGLSAGRVELSGEKDALNVRAGSTRARLLGIPAAEFPEVDVQKAGEASLPFDAFGEGLKRVLFAVSVDEGRPVLTGVKFGSAEGQEKKLGAELVMTATDGFRLSIARIRAPKMSLSKTAIIPGKTLAEVARLASGDNIEFGFTSDESVVFSFDGGWISGRLLAGEFPPAEKIIPTSFDVTVAIDRRELEQAIRVSAIFARESANIIRWSIKDERLTISANSPQIGENETAIPVTGRGSGDIAFNSRYLLDWLGSVDTEQVEFGMVGPLKPGVFWPAGDRSYTHVIMPVRTQKEESSG